MESDEPGCSLFHQMQIKSLSREEVPVCPAGCPVPGIEIIRNIRPAGCLAVIGKQSVQGRDGTLRIRSCERNHLPPCRDTGIGSPGRDKSGRAEIFKKAEPDACIDQHPFNGTEIRLLL